jgi:hypothetical protein
MGEVVSLISKIAQKSEEEEYMDIRICGHCKNRGFWLLEDRTAICSECNAPAFGIIWGFTDKT